VSHPGRSGDSRAEETPEGLLHPVRGRDAEPVLAGRLRPLPAGKAAATTSRPSYGP
jgi:hypothetical protein